MVVCKFFLQGNCRFGENCRNEHPSNNSGGQNQNRFGVLANNSGGGNRPGAASNSTDASIISRDAPGDLDPQKARPKWIFSSYGPTKTAPVSLMEENEFSSEEIRLRYYLAASTGQDAQADQEATQMYQKINQDYQSILNNVSNIPKFLDDGEKKRPNRHDFTNVSLFDGRKTRDQFIQEMTSNTGSAFRSAPGTTSAFGSGASSSGFGSGASGSGPNPFIKAPTAAFGQAAGPSAFGNKPAFGQSGFGSNSSSNPSATPAPAFGQSTFGKPAAGSGFGQPAFGATGFGQGAQKNPFAPAAAASGFGQAAPAFGQSTQSTSTFGQPSQPSSGFGQAAQPTSTFGQPTGFGQPSQPGSSTGFGQPAQPSPSSGFGQPSQPGSSSGFGQPAQPGSNTSFGKPPQPTSTFGQPNQPTNPFGAQSSSFGKPAFGSTPQPNSAFGQRPQQNNGTGTSFDQPSGGFGQPSTGFGKPSDQEMDSESTQRPNPFGAAPSTSTASGFGTQPTQPQPQSQPQQHSTAPTTSAGVWNPTNPLISRPSTPLHITQRLPAQPPAFDMSKRLTAFRGQRVTYIDPPHIDRSNLPEQYQDMMAAALDPFPAYQRPDTRQPEKIWFPNGPAEKTVEKLGDAVKRLDFEGGEDEYTEAVKDAYRGLYEAGEWRGGIMPLVPPAREWVSYDF